MFPTKNLIQSLLVLLIALMHLSLLNAAESSFPITDISITDQNALIENYCAFCHLDNAMNGGLSLEHFDALTMSPALAAILANKFTTGVPIEELLQPEFTPQLIEKIEAGKEYGAPSVMNISGLPLPAEGEINGFIMAMVNRSDNADQWHVIKDGNQTIADIARAARLPEVEYVQLRDQIIRLVVSCDASSRAGEILLTWSPIPMNGNLEVIVDSESAKVFVIDVQEPMANGGPGASAPSSVILIGKNKLDEYPELSIPHGMLRIKGPLVTEQVEISFRELWEMEPELFDACFAG